MANHEINEEQEAVNKALRMIETSDPVHADVYNALFSVLINNDVFLEKLANKMVQQVMISHVMDSTNPDMVMGADQGPVITQLIEKVQEKVDVLNTNAKKVGNLTVKNVCCNGGGYGRTLCINGDYYGKAAPTNMDCYYITIDGSTYKLYIGLQQHGTSVVTWH